MNAYLIESCCEETNEVFWDIVPGDTPNDALEEWSKVRDDYATCCMEEPWLLSDWIKLLKSCVKDYEGITPEIAARDWEQWKKEIGWEPEGEEGEE